MPSELHSSLLWRLARNPQSRSPGSACGSIAGAAVRFYCFLGAAVRGSPRSQGRGVHSLGDEELAKSSPSPHLRGDMAKMIWSWSGATSLFMTPRLWRDLPQQIRTSVTNCMLREK